MEALPDELTLAVLCHIQPLRDTAAVSLTCRRWSQLMLDPPLWQHFHHRAFPVHSDPPAAPTAADGPPRLLRYRPMHVEVVKPMNWRHSFTVRAWQLKAAIEDSHERKKAEKNGYDVRLLAAAQVGCLPLAQRLVAQFVAKHGDRSCDVPYGEDARGNIRVVDQCLRLSCMAGSTPTAQVQPSCTYSVVAVLEATVVSGSVLSVCLINLL
jgi:hypothetical protein